MLSIWTIATTISIMTTLCWNYQPFIEHGVMGLLQRNHSYQAKILSGISLALAIASTQMGRGLIVPLGMDTGRPQERIGR